MINWQTIQPRTAVEVLIKGKRVKMTVACPKNKVLRDEHGLDWGAANLEVYEIENTTQTGKN